MNESKLINKSLILILSIVLLAGCSDGSSRITKEAEYTNLQSCLLGLQRELGGKLDIARDNQNIVAGIQKGGVIWSCTRESSGTKGIYWVGSYTM